MKGQDSCRNIRSKNLSVCVTIASEKNKAAEKRLAEIAVLEVQIANYAKTRETYVAYNKEGNYNMIFTSNKNPALWREDFDEDATLLCALDRIFDDATVFKLRGESFRGKKLETVSLQTGKVKAVEPMTETEE